MVRTGARLAILADLLRQAGACIDRFKPPPPRITSLPAALAADIVALYQALGGVKSEPTLRPGSWDLALEGGLVLELDEELHFNRYRKTTLGRAWTVALPWQGEYHVQCQEREPDCLKAGSWGKRWTNRSCEEMFGQAAPPGDFSGRGAPRWKQRALYDAIKDAHALTSDGYKVARVSIFDHVEGIQLGHALTPMVPIDPSAVLRLVENRTA